MEIRFTDLIKESRVITEGRKEDARDRYPLIPEEIFNLFIEEDPSGNNKYLNWLVKVWWEEKCSRYAERGPDDYYYRQYCNNSSESETLMEDISYFHEKPSKYTQTGIDQFTSIQSFSNATREARLAVTKGELKKQATKLYETDRYLVVEPHSHASSCYYGAGTQWCTTMRNHDSYFKQYYVSNSLYYFMNKKTGKKRAFLTSLGTPMFGPNQYGRNTDWTFAGEREYNNFTGRIFTETDNQGRSFRGIPEDARKVMQDAHKEKTKKWVKGLDDGRKKIELMTKLGMEGVPEPTSVDSWDTDSGVIPSTVTEITGDFSLSDGGSLGNVTTIGGTLHIAIDGNYTITKLESVRDITITDGSISLGSLRGELGTLFLSGTGKLRHAGGITKIDTLKLHNMNITKTLLNSLDITNIHFNNVGAQETLSKVFRNSEVTVTRW